MSRRDPEGDLERLRQLVHDLRNPVGAVGMAVAMLQDQLEEARSRVDEALAQRIDTTLCALVESARQLRHLVSEPMPRSSRALVAVSSGVEVPAEALEALPRGPQEPRGSTPEPVAVESTVRPVTRRSASQSDEIRSRERALAAGTVALEEVLGRLEAVCAARSEAIELRCESEPGLRVRADGSELLRALSNLVDNGAEAAGGSSASLPVVVVRAFASGGDTCIEVRDEACCLPSAVKAWIDAPRTDEPPVSHKRDGGVHGVGLRVARRVAEESGGRLEWDETRQHTVLRLRIPLDPFAPPIPESI